MRISVIGAGYVGLVSGVCFAEKGHYVVCVDSDRKKVDQINRAVCPIYEEGLEELLRKNVPGKLWATTDLRSAVTETDISFITVGTPSKGREIDLGCLQEVSRQVGEALKEKSTYHVVVVKSTVVPGTTDHVVLPLLVTHSGKRAGIDFGVGMNPEFLREGVAIRDFMLPDRIVLGGMDEATIDVLEEVYSRFDGVPALRSTNKTAEMIKYVTNSLLATLISFSNEVANLCSAVPGIDAREVWRGVHLDRRLTSATTGTRQPAAVVEYLWHGLGFGGSCLPKDVKALCGFGKQMGVPTPILDSVLVTNAMQPLRLVALLETEMEIKGSTVAVLGLSFKPGTDDLRESPALPVVAGLRKRGARVVVHDPVSLSKARTQAAFAGAEFVCDWQGALRGADACCFITRWPEYQRIQPEDFIRLMRRPLVIDGRGIFEPHRLLAAGVVWRGIGYTPPKSLGDLRARGYDRLT